MSMSDPISDMLARIRNGILSRKAFVQLPASRLKADIAGILQNEGFISGYRVEGEQAKRTLVIDLKWSNANESAILGLKRISRPGRRLYVGKESIPSVRGGQGIAILTTSKGVVSDGMARKESVGGEVICEVW